MLEARGLGYRARDKWLLRGVDVSLYPGEFLAILGPNGSGKTTLLRILAGELQATEGEVRLMGKPLAIYGPTHLARVRAVLSQAREVAFPFTGYEVAFLGRLPHLENRRETEEDHERTLIAMEKAQAVSLRYRLVQSLSGGESMRVEVARLLNQEPEVFLLDEPTNHLDPRYAVELLLLFRSLAQEGRGVVAVLHDVNLASLFAHRILLLKEGRTVAYGEPEEVLRPDRLEMVYDVPFQRLGKPQGGFFVLPKVQSFC